jgi:RNA polymerase sigma-70 factor (ECF subfamily)
MKRIALVPGGQRPLGARRAQRPLAPVACSVVPDGPDESVSIALRIREGDPSAESALVERFGRGVRVILRHVAGDPTLVDDLYQETFRVALERIRRGGLRNPAQLAAFLAGLARHLATDHFRRARRGSQESVSVLEHVAAAGPSSFDALSQRDQVDRVRRTLEGLSTERDRDVLRRFYLTADDKDCICADLGLTRLQFNRVLYRARERFRELWLAEHNSENILTG